MAALTEDASKLGSEGGQLGDLLLDLELVLAGDLVDGVAGAVARSGSTDVSPCLLSVPRAPDLGRLQRLRQSQEEHDDGL